MADKEEVELPTDNDYDIIYFDDGRTSVIDTGESDKLTKEEIEKEIPDYWVVMNSETILNIYYDLKEKSVYSFLLDEIEYCYVAEYLEYVHFNNPIDDYEWSREIVYENNVKYPRKKNPPYKVWAQHFLVDLYTLYEDMQLNYSYINFGGFETFMRFVYENSSSRFLIE